MQNRASLALVGILTFLTLVSLTGFQVTSETSSVRMMGRLGAALIELDRWLPVHRHDIELLARDRPEQPLVLTNLPIEVVIPASAALAAPEPVLKAMITESMGRQLYSDGASAVRDEQGQSHLGLTEPLRWAIDSLDRSAHGFWRIATVITGLTLLAVCAGYLWTRRSPFPGVAAGSLAGAAGAMAAWLALTALNSSANGALDREIAAVAQDGVWLGVRNSLAAAAIGLGGWYVYSSLAGPTRHRDWDGWDEYDLDDSEFDSEGRQSPPY